MADTREQLGVRINQPLGADDAARLLVGEGRQHKVAGRAASGLRAECGADHHRHAALHVECPAAP